MLLCKCSVLFCFSSQLCNGKFAFLSLVISGHFYIEVQTGLPLTKCKGFHQWAIGSIILNLIHRLIGTTQIFIYDKSPLNTNTLSFWGDLIQFMHQVIVVFWWFLFSLTIDLRSFLGIFHLGSRSDQMDRWKPLRLNSDSPELLLLSRRGLPDEEVWEPAWVTRGRLSLRAPDTTPAPGPRRGETHRSLTVLFSDLTLDQIP